MTERPLEQPQPPSPEFAPSAMVVLATAQQEALSFNHPYVGTEHVLMGLMHDGTTSGWTRQSNK